MLRNVKSETSKKLTTSTNLFALTSVVEQVYNLAVSERISYHPRNFIQVPLDFDRSEDKILISGYCCSIILSMEH